METRSLGLTLVCLAALAQTQPQAPPVAPAPVFSVTSTLVQVDAVVTDSKGRHINDLRPEEFEIYEDGKLQPLTNFSLVRIASDSGRPPTRNEKKPPVDLPPAPAAPLRLEDVRRTVVLMVDDLGLSFESMASTRAALHTFIEKALQPGDLVAICRTGNGSSALRQFTTDKRVLLAIADGLTWNPNGRGGLDLFDAFGTYGSSGGGVNPSGNHATRDAAYDIERNAEFTLGTLGAVSAVASGVRNLPGRKSIILFSDGIRFVSDGDLPSLHATGGSMTLAATAGEINEAFHKLIDRANRAGIVIYTVHTAGLQPLQLTAQDNPKFASGSATRHQQLRNVTEVGLSGRDVAFNAAQQGLGSLADTTGGVAYENTNDLDDALRRTVEDQNSYYLLGYRPTAQTLQQDHGRLAYHKITVRVTRPGLRVRTRTGFFGATDEDTRPRFETPLQQMRAAMLSPFQQDGLRLRLTALYIGSANGRPAIRNLVQIDARDLQFTRHDDGSLSANLDVVAAATGVGEVPLASVAQSYDLEVPADRAAAVLAEGALYALNVTAPGPGAYQIRVAVRDPATGKIGSASQFLAAPDVRKRRLALTSVVLGGTAGMAPAVRRFHAGGQIDYLSVVQSSRPKPPDTLTARIRVVNGNREVFTGAAPIVRSAGTAAVQGGLRIPPTFPPGQYYLELLLSPAATKSPVDRQWIDFEITP